MARAYLVLLAVNLAACGDDSSAGPPPPDEYIVNCDSAADAGTFTSDENYSAFVNAEAAHRVLADPCKSPQLATPTPGSTLDRSTPPMIAFANKGPTCQLRLAQPVLMAACRLHQAPLWRKLVRAFLLEGVAEAHCGAFSGENYLLRLLHAGEAKPVYMAMLSVTSFTPDPIIWQKAMRSRNGQTLTMTIERALFFRGDIMDGPYIQPQPYSFQVAP
ncbi:MAG TPA: hypothetical protein VKN99_27410 [Polyangia bacterium]|nr:hypothetical protein [Polyangia bacterium]